MTTPGGNATRKSDNEGDVELHKGVTEGIETEVPEFIGKVGAYQSELTIEAGCGCASGDRLTGAGSRSASRRPNERRTQKGHGGGYDVDLSRSLSSGTRSSIWSAIPSLFETTAYEEKATAARKRKRLPPKPVSKKREKVENIVDDGELRNRPSILAKTARTTGPCRIKREARSADERAVRRRIIKFVAKSIVNFRQGKKKPVKINTLCRDEKGVARQAPKVRSGHFR